MPAPTLLLFSDSTCALWNISVGKRLWSERKLLSKIISRTFKKYERPVRIEKASQFNISKFKIIIRGRPAGVVGCLNWEWKRFQFNDDKILEVKCSVNDDLKIKWESLNLLLFLSNEEANFMIFELLTICKNSYHFSRVLNI